MHRTWILRIQTQTGIYPVSYLIDDKMPLIRCHLDLELCYLEDFLEDSDSGVTQDESSEKSRSITPCPRPIKRIKRYHSGFELAESVAEKRSRLYQEAAKVFAELARLEAGP